AQAPVDAPRSRIARSCPRDAFPHPEAVHPQAVHPEAARRPSTGDPARAEESPHAGDPPRARCAAFVECAVMGPQDFRGAHTMQPRPARRAADEPLTRSSGCEEVRWRSRSKIPWRTLGGFVTFLLQP